MPNYRKDVAIVDYITVYDSNDTAVTGLVDGNFTKYAAVDGVTDALTVTVTEIANGRYKVSFTPDAVGRWQVLVQHATYQPRGWEGIYDVVTATEIDFLEGDETIDTAVTPWDQVVKLKGGATEILRKELRTAASADVTADTTVVGRRTEP